MNGDGIAGLSEDAERSESDLAEISRGLVRLYREHFGKGPIKTRTEFAGPNVVICSLEGTLTPAEQRLVEMGEHQRLRDNRLFFQHATERQFAEVVEEVLGRKVRAFTSGTDTMADVSSEVFYLERT
jgi:uncharacterized protein YbcI